MPTSLAQGLFDEAEKFEENGLYQEAIEAYEKAIKVNPSLVRAHHNLAILYHQANQFDRAITNLKKAIGLNPGDASAYNNLGVLFCKTQQFDKAKESFEKALSIEGDYQEARDNLGKVLQKLRSVTKVRHILPSYILSLDDEPFCPNQKLLDLGLAAAKRAVTIDLDAVSQLFPENIARFINMWPGEHYRLLAAIVLEIEPRVIIEIGTATGASSLTMKKFLPPGGKIVTYDIMPWDKCQDSGLKQADFDERLEQRIVDLSDRYQAFSEIELLRTANLIFVDAAKDGKMEQCICNLFDSISFNKSPIVIFDDIKFVDMIRIWRNIQHPKLDLTSFGHWSGTGLVEWG